MRASTAALIVMLSAACGAGAQTEVPVAQRDDPIVGLWEGRKVDGRYQTTEPWGPFRIERKADGSLAATYLGSRLGDRDLEMYDVGLDGDRFHLKMNRWGGAVLEARLDPEKGIVGTLRHHGMVEDLHLERIPDRSHRDVLALLESGGIAAAPPYQSEVMSVLTHHGPEAARKIYDAVRAQNPDHQLWGPSAVNGYGYELLNENRTAEAVEVFELNAMAYPDDANSFDSLGEGYLRNGDKELAIEALRKSLSLKPSPQVRDNSMKLLRELGVDVYKADRP